MYCIMTVLARFWPSHIKNVTVKVLFMCQSNLVSTYNFPCDNYCIIHVYVYVRLGNTFYCSVARHLCSPTPHRMAALMATVGVLRARITKHFLLFRRTTFVFPNAAQDGGTNGYRWRAACEDTMYINKSGACSDRRTLLWPLRWRLRGRSPSNEGVVAHASAV